jgi:hypothetical protein
MRKMKRINPCALLFLGILLIATGCGTQTTPEPTATTIPATPTETAIPPTVTAAPPTEIPVQIEIVFDGESCELTYPEELKPGDYTVRLTNQTDGSEGIWCSYLADGHTEADLDAMQENPGEYFGAPDWVISLTKVFSGRDATGYRLSTFKFDQPGEYVCSTGTTLPPTLFGCGNLIIVQE